MEIKKLVICRGRVNLKVAGVHDDPERGVDRQRHTIDKTMGYLNRMDGKGSNAEALPRLDFAQLGVVQKPVFFQLVFHIGERELRAPYRHVQLGQNPGQRPNVIFVSMGQYNCAYTLTIFNQIGNIWNNYIYAQEFGFGKHQAGVDDDNVVAPAQGHAVHTELAKPAEGHNVKFSRCHWDYLML